MYFIRFINGIYPLQVGGVRNYTLGYPNRALDNRAHRLMPFKGCIRNIIDNGKMYDLRFPLLSFKTEIGCSHFAEMFCPPCFNGVCDMSTLNMVLKSYACQCHHGWTGVYCDQRKYCCFPFKFVLQIFRKMMRVEPNPYVKNDVYIIFKLFD